MKFCEPHWEQLKDKIKELGMWDLVSKGGQDLAERMQAEISGKGDGKWNFDPLMSAHNMIVTNAVRAGGLYLLEGDLCPLCELDKNKEAMKEDSTVWIEKAAQGALEYCREKGLVAPVQ